MFYPEIASESNRKSKAVGRPRPALSRWQRENRIHAGSPMHIPNPLSPDRMSAAERLDEIADILAAGLRRLRARKSSCLSGDQGESPLAMSPDQRLHAGRDQEHGA
jgi:hypothetical protein